MRKLTGEVKEFAQGQALKKCGENRLGKRPMGLQRPKV